MSDPYHLMDAKTKNAFQQTQNDVSNLDKVFEIINNRPVGILCRGHSIAEWVERINEFKDFDICWIGVNHEYNFNLALSKIGKQVEVVTAYPAQYFDRKYQAYKLTYDTHGGCSLYKIICQLLTHVPKIMLFGADGFAEESEKKYYFQDLMEATREQHKEDVRYINDKIKRDDVMNVSPKSKITAFPKYTYDECLEWLSGKLK